MTKAEPTILLAAGGTGGHLFVAQALAEVLTGRGCVVHLATDERGTRYGAQFPAAGVHAVPSATPSGGSVAGMARAGIEIAKGVFAAGRLLARIKPAAVIGFGGYPSVPPVLAAGLFGIPAALHEQNSVLGRANRLLAARVRVIATGFPAVRGLKAAYAGKQVHTGNPVRPAVLALAGTPLPPFGAADRLRILVFGGSQGARVMSDVVPKAMERLSARERARVTLVQQCREEDLDRVGSAYGRMGVEAELAPFFTDLPSRMAAAHLVVSRSGASTVAELGVIGRPAILVPYGASLDGDQAANAAAFSAAGGATVIQQPEFTPERLAEEILRRINEPALMAEAARAAVDTAMPHAAVRLADAVMRAAGLPLSTETTS